MKIIIINGPNLNLLGKREPEIYGSISFDAYFKTLQNKFVNLKLEYFQSNHEGLLIDKLHEVGFSYSAIILNAGALTHYSYALYDAIKAIATPVFEVHISDIHSREEFRKISIIKSVCVETISGYGLRSYDMAIESALSKY